MKSTTLLGASRHSLGNIFRIAAVACWAVLALCLCAASNAAWANEQDGLENSWRYQNGQRIDTYTATANCIQGEPEQIKASAGDTTSESQNTASTAASGRMMLMSAKNPQVVDVNGYKVWDGFATFSKGYCSGKTSKRGVDVSEHNCTGNKAAIDWAKVKADGVDFAIIRCGYGSEWSTDGKMITSTSSTAKIDTSQDDKAFITNVKACQKQGVPFGVYLYSYATTKSEAISEAVHTIRLLKAAGLKPTDLSYPIFYDLEDSYLFDGCSNTVSAKKTRLNTLASGYFTTLENAGWKAVGTYASTSWWEDYLTSSIFTSHATWVAEWNTTAGLTYEGLKDFYEKRGTWQFTDSGVVAGIQGVVDLNYSDYQHDVGWNESAEGKAYYDANGKPLTGVHWIDGKLYYFGSDGIMKTSCFYTYSDGTRSYFSKTGAALTGWWTMGDYEMYFSKSAAKTLKGVHKLGDYYYKFDSLGHMMTSCWHTYSNGHKSYFCRNGHALTGWWTIGGNKYYFYKKNAQDLHGAHMIGTKGYCFNSAGVMQVSKWAKWTSGDNAGKYSYFCRTGSALTGTWTISGVKYDFGTTGAISTSAAHLAMDKKAGARASNTKYLVLADVKNCRVGIYQGKKGAWTCIKYWYCSPGASSSPTPTGTYTITDRGYSFTSFGTRCYYYTQFWGDYLFHSVCYTPDGSKIADGRLGKKISHGCVRLKTENAKWMYKNIPNGTKVYIYR